MYKRQALAPSGAGAGGSKSGANLMFLGEEEEGDGVLDVYEGVGFLQHESEEPMVQEARRTLREDRL